jgi:hypothetical protein
MCSITGGAGAADSPAAGVQADLAARLARAIDDLAAAANASAEGEDLAVLLARAWAVVAAADPQLAARTAHYTR